MSPLRNYIKRIGEIEFAIKALVAYKLGQGDTNFLQHIPACKNTKYAFLIQTFIGQTMRKPVDILCIGRKDSDIIVTTIEVKNDLAGIDDLVQLLKYQEIFRIRNIDKGSLTYKFSSCLLAKRFQPELVDYVSMRNIIMNWEEVILLKYVPTSNGKDATFTVHTLPKPSLSFSKARPRIEVDVSQASLDPMRFYSGLGKKIPPKTSIEFLSTQDNVMILRKCYIYNNQKVTLGNVLAYAIDGKCGLKEFTDFINHLRTEAEKFQGDFMALEPVLIAEAYDGLIEFFIEQYNKYEIQARRQPISAFISKAQ
jgi:hypothetical protein